MFINNNVGRCWGQMSGASRERQKSILTANKKAPKKATSEIKKPLPER